MVSGCDTARVVPSALTMLPERTPVAKVLVPSVGNFDGRNLPVNVPAPAASVNVPDTSDVRVPRSLAATGAVAGAAGAADAGAANSANMPVNAIARTAAAKVVRRLDRFMV